MPYSRAEASRRLEVSTAPTPWWMLLLGMIPIATVISIIGVQEVRRVE